MRNMTEDSGYSCGRGHPWLQPPNSVFCFKRGGGFVVVSPTFLISTLQHHLVSVIPLLGLQTHDETPCQAGLYPLSGYLSKPSPMCQQTWGDRERTRRSVQASWRPSALLRWTVFAWALCFMTCTDVTWFLCLKYHTHTLCCDAGSGLLFLIHRTEKLLSDETRHEQHPPLQNSSTWETCHQLPIKSSAMYTLPPSLPAPNHKHTKSLWEGVWTSGLQVLVQ